MAEILEPSSRKRKLAAILDADVVGFSRLMGEDEAGTHQALGKLRRAVDPLITEHGGRIVGTAGDSLLADFSSVVDALSCAVEMQQAARAINDPISPTSATSSSTAIISSAMASTSPRDSRRSPSPARSAFRRPSTTRSGTSSISITVRSAAIVS